MSNFPNAIYRDHHLCEEPDCEEKKFVVFRYLLGIYVLME